VIRLKDEIIKRADKIGDRLVAHRRRLHKIAEVGFELPNTLEYIKAALEKCGYEVRQVGRAGLVAETGDGEGKTVLLRADIDALPIGEESGVAYAAKNGNMHACGHDIHTAMLLGAAEIISNYLDKIHGRIIFVFQPAEEILEGAKDMIEAGLLDCHIDYAMMIHVITGTELQVGYTVVSSEGVSASSSDFFKITVTGKSAHGSTPNAGKDALGCAARILLSIEGLPSREFAVSDDVTLSVGTFYSGVAANVIAERAELCGTARAYSEDVRARLIERLGDITHAISSAFGCEGEIEITSSCPTLKNDRECSIRTEKYARELFGEQMCAFSSELGTRGGGSDDFAYISQRAPSVMVAMSAGSVSEGYKYPIHNPRAAFSEDVICRGAALFAYCGLRFLGDAD